ncbi:MAG TPA: DNA topoisomerase IB [Candidatus Baltobacteraceae bacterium]|jgi:DNA topoisomerase-1|nr:DNA topoisomerase IB [Candidatus Baltobacteraceae bacterium]
MTTPNVEALLDPVAAAKSAGLRYVSDSIPGIRRRRHGQTFAYFDPNGKEIEDDALLKRIKSLAVPPAYEDVWICPLENGHLQATGRDARGRKQYRYHKRWREVRDETKYGKMIAFAERLPKIRTQVDADLALPGLPREKVLATIVQLLETTAIRVGNDEYAKENNSFGLTTLRNKHAKVDGSTVRFSFKGKSGVKHAIDLRDRRLARIIRQCQDLPGQQLFEYIGDDGETRSVDSSDVNDYIRAISGEEFSAKDFRTWVGTVSCAMLLAQEHEAQTQTERKAYVTGAIKDVAKRLGNTPTVCRKCYVHPDVVEAYMEEGRFDLQRKVRHTKGLLDEERFVLALLRERAALTDSGKTMRALQKSLRARKKKAA